PGRTKKDDWRKEEGQFFYQNKLLIDEVEEQKTIIKDHHDSLSAGHPGRLKTYQLIKKAYWWPGMMKQVEEYVKGCATCQQAKVNMHPTTVPLIPNQTPKTAEPMKYLSVDFITDLPESSGYDSIMVVVDQGLSKGVILSPCHKTINALETTQIFHDSIFKQFGLHDKLISNRGPQFASEVSKELHKLLNIETALSSAYHPQTDGQTERSNQELEIYLCIFCQNQPHSWAKYLTTAEFCHSQRPHSTNNQSPFYLLMGYEARGIPTKHGSTNIPSVEKRLSELLR
ncbi:hypothetical protein SERLA73DRAFT_23371, partial [Serpula lacrymans var. lacrymans S7.3]